MSDEVVDVMMKQARAQKISDVRAYVCEYALREVITTVGFGAQSVNVESAAVSSYQCSWTSFHWAFLPSLFSSFFYTNIYTYKHRSFVNLIFLTHHPSFFTF